MTMLGTQAILFAVEAVEHRSDRRVVDRLLAVVGDQVLLTDIGDIGRFRVFREQVIKGLVLGRPHRFGDCVVPFVAIGELRIDIEDDSAEVEQPVADDFADSEPCLRHRK